MRYIRYIKSNIELLFWAISLIALALMNPDVEGISLCPFTMLTGYKCFGCGLGHSISYLLHGEAGKSVAAHWLGPLVVLGIITRIYTLVRLKIIIRRRNNAKE
ncbi:MAG: DUF2752 domain-containing protein [Hyphomicrobiales bacterium]